MSREGLIWIVGSSAVLLSYIGVDVFIRGSFRGYSRSYQKELRRFLQIIALTALAGVAIAAMLS